MGSEQQYIDLYEQAREMIFSHAPGAMNTIRNEAFEDFRRQGFPSKKVERYKYTDTQKLFAPDYGVNLNRSSRNTRRPLSGFSLRCAQLEYKSLFCS